MKRARLAVVVSALAAACAEAGGDVKGGTITDAGEQAATPGEFTAASVDRNAPCGTGDTWSSLYRDIFGRAGQPGSCSFQSTCHGTPGTVAQQRGIVCMDEKGCRQSMIDRSLVSAGFAEVPENAVLFGILKTWSPKTGKPRGIMPLEPADYVFPDACVDRMKAWIRRGVPAD